MKAKGCLVVGLICVLTSFSGCTGGTNRKKLMSLELGMSKQEVLNLMKAPQLNEAYRTQDGGSLEVFFYNTSFEYTHQEIEADCVERAICVPLVFENGRLIGWGKQFYENRIKVELEITHKSQ